MVVYNESMKKNLMQLGRSMVEMLGVLAIIGVLSIVGIYGYKNAMNKIHNSELADLILTSYREAFERNYLQGVKPSRYAFGTAATDLKMDRPSWFPDTGVIQLRLQPDTNTPYESQTYHMVIVRNLESCDLCSNLKEVTLPSTAGYRLLPTNISPVPVRVYCCQGGYNTEGCNCSNWP